MDTAQTFFSFTDSALNIRMSGTELKLQWSPSPIAAEKNHRGGWDECWPTFRLFRPAEIREKGAYEFNLQVRGDTELLAQKQAAFDAFRSSIPGPVVSFVERFGSHQWTMLKLLHKTAAFELAQSNLVLTYCLANTTEFREIDPSPADILAASYSHGKQRAIAKWLGFPGSEAIVNLLKKITPEAAYPSILRRLKYALLSNEETMVLLSHHKRINAGLLELVVNPHLRSLSTPKLLTEVATNQDDEVAGTTAGLALDAIAIVQRIAPERKIRPFLSIAQVREFAQTINGEYIEHQRLQETAKRQGAAVHRRAIPQKGMFPPPPIPGTREIIPLVCATELKKEGQGQHNCVGFYTGRIRRGGIYIYRVMYPERATLSIIKGADGCWHRDQMEKAYNCQVRQSTKHFVDNWLAKYLISV